MHLFNIDQSTVTTLIYECASVPQTHTFRRGGEAHHLSTMITEFNDKVVAE